MLFDLVMNHARGCPLERLDFERFFLRKPQDEPPRDNDWGGKCFRYRTPVGPIRLDFGFLIPSLQVINGTAPPNAFNIFRFIRGGVPGAIHFTIGESF